MNNRKWIWIVKFDLKRHLFKIWAQFPSFPKNEEKDFTEKYIIW